MIGTHRVVFSEKHWKIDVRLRSVPADELVCFGAEKHSEIPPRAHSHSNGFWADVGGR